MVDYHLQCVYKENELIDPIYVYACIHYMLLYIHMAVSVPGSARLMRCLAGLLIFFIGIQRKQRAYWQDNQTMVRSRQRVVYRRRLLQCHVPP